MAGKNVSVYLSYLLRHHPEDAGVHMDIHGWVSVQELLDGINTGGKYMLTDEKLKEIVASDEKGRYRFSGDGKKIKACQGHSIPWVVPELTYGAPPEYLYHGTNTVAYGKILHSGAISKMERHAVHLQADPNMAWKSAARWRKTPVLLKIDAKRMYDDGFRFGVSENAVWCTESVPEKYICEAIGEI